MGNKGDEGPADEEEDEDALKPFECGVCSGKFSTVEKLEIHVLKTHEEPGAAEPNSGGGSAATHQATKSNGAVNAAVIDEVADEFAGEVAAFEAAEEKAK